MSRKKHTGDLRQSSIAALRKDLRAYQSSAYPVGPMHVRNLLKSRGATEKGANRIISLLLKRDLAR